MPNGELSVVFLRSDEMRSINQRFRGRDYATDVLSFSYANAENEGIHFIGEILIVPEIAAGNAACYGDTLETELRKLLVHGTLHLLGYDHETDNGQMNRMQAKLMRRKLLMAVPPLVIRR